MMKKLLLLLAMSSSIGLTAQNIIYVDVNVPGGNNDGLSWTDAYNNLQNALAAATSNDEIWIARGTYKPGALETDSFNIPANVTLLGGFSGTEANAEARNWARNPTILSGDLDGSNTANAGDSHTIVKMSQNNSRLDAFIIQYSYADDTENSPIAIGRAGAGVYNSGNNTIINCKFHNNNAQGTGTNGIGGAFISFSGNVTITNSLFFNNTASGNGGAISSENGTVNLINCTLANNEATNGGGVHFFNGNITAVNSIFTNNSGAYGNIHFGGGSGSGTGTVSYSLLYNSTAGNNGEIPQSIVNDGNNIAATTGSNGTGTDPVYNAINNNNGYQLMQNSPGLDAGNNTANTSIKALGGNNRFVDGTANGTATIDLGAYETVLQFTDIAVSLPGVTHSSVAWGDYDNDGDLDIVLTGSNYGEKNSKIYRNDAGVFTDIVAGLTGVYRSSVAWGDYDNDGDLDIVLAGSTNNGRISKIYNNNEGSFTDITAGLTGVTSSSVAWGDYDNDGDLDIILAGNTGSTYFSKIYNNNEGIFTDITAGLTGVSNGSVAWGDYDNDGDLDIVLTGLSNSGGVSKIYQNDAGVFTQISTTLPTYFESSVAWGDYDNDGDLDVLISGRTSYGGSSQQTNVYRNNNGTFTDINAGLSGVGNSSVSWGDYDNDGDLDILITGSINGSADRISKVYRNDDGIFTNIATGLTSVMLSSVAWGDYDNDGDLDILLTGASRTDQISKIYRNNAQTPNTVPTAPANPTATINADNTVTLSWDAATDNETPSAALSYNLFVKESPVSTPSYNINPMAQENNGWRQVAQIGNVGQNMSYTWNILTEYQNANTDFLFKVQAIDNAFAGSPFSDAHTFSLNLLNIDNISKNTFSIYPNPVNNRLHIKTNMQQYNYVIYSIQGQEILKANSQRSKSIELSKLPSGIYLLKLSNETKSESFKIIKQ